MTDDASAQPATDQAAPGETPADEAAQDADTAPAGDTTGDTDAPAAPTSAPPTQRFLIVAPAGAIVSRPDYVDVVELREGDPPQNMQVHPIWVQS